MLNIRDVIRKKRDGEDLTEEEIRWVVRQISQDAVADCQLGSFLMALYINGMKTQETAWLTDAMVHSGHVMSWPKGWARLVVDKHSTGGVGDKTSLPLAPALAVLGLKVPMISGRGLGITGGTLDKLESIPGYRATLTAQEMMTCLSDVGCCIVGQTSELVPADRKMYQTRDVTCTVESIPLIVGSIMSKKLAESPAALVLELTYGCAAPMKTEADARNLAQKMIDTGTELGVNTSALLTRMDRPMGKMVGNSLEVIEAVQCLNGGGPRDLHNTVCQLGGELLRLVGKAQTREDGFLMIQNTLRDGRARQKFSEMLQAQGVNPDDAQLLCRSPEATRTLLPLAVNRTQLLASSDGYVTALDALSCGRVCHALGAGRSIPSDNINMGVGLEIHVQVGDKTTQGESWVTVYHDESELAPELTTLLESAIVISDESPSIREQITITDHMTGAP